MNDDFLPTDYEVPSESNYMRFQQGENRFRILSKPIIGWEDWKDKKPLRFQYNNKPKQAVDPTKPIKHFWAMVVWDYAKNKVSILEITQKSILSIIQGLCKDPDWGNPTEYDIKVKKTGSDMETKYETTPTPHKALAENIKTAFYGLKIDLNALFTGNDPFNPSVKVAESGDPGSDESQMPPPDDFGNYESLPF
jgi:hypothetical protein